MSNVFVIKCHIIIKWRVPHLRTAYTVTIFMFPRSLQMPFSGRAIPSSCNFHFKFSATERLATVGCNFTEQSVTSFTLTGIINFLSLHLTYSLSVLLPLSAGRRLQQGVIGPFSSHRRLLHLHSIWAQFLRL